MMKINPTSCYDCQKKLRKGEGKVFDKMIDAIDLYRPEEHIVIGKIETDQQLRCNPCSELYDAYLMIYKTKNIKKLN